LTVTVIIIIIIVSSAAAGVLQNLLECSPELHVEYGVDDRVQETIHVAEPDEEREENRIDPTDGDLIKQVVADTDGVNDVDCEERNPAQQKHTCKQHGHVMQYRYN